MIVNYKMNSHSWEQIKEHLFKVDQSFTPALSTYINIEAYALKLYTQAICIEAVNNDKLIGLVAGYHNREENLFYISNVSVDSDFQGKGISSTLFDKLSEFCTQKKVKVLNLQVFKTNVKALKFYKKLGFKILSEENLKYNLVKLL